jgi:phosphate transport system ATP-binding protein
MSAYCSKAVLSVSSMQIEETIEELEGGLHIVIVTHNLQQAARVSDFVAFMYLGELVEFDAARDICETQGRTHTGFHYGRFG